MNTVSFPAASPETAHINAPAGTVAFHFDGEKMSVVYATDKYFDIFMCTRAEYIAIPANQYGLRMIDESASKSFIAEINDELGKNSNISINIFPTLKNGQALTVNYAINPVRNEDGTYTLYCSTLDISKYHTGKSAVDSDEYRRMCAISSISADIIYEYDFNDKTMSFFVNCGGEYVPKSVVSDFESMCKEKKAFHEDDTEAFERFCDMLQIGNDKYMGEIRLYNEATEEYEWHRVRFKTIIDMQTGLPIKAIGEFANISEKKNAEQKLIDKAERDPLTKIYNKATTRSMIKNYLRTDSRESYDALIIVDVDNFKHVNDSLGHLFGDSILVDLSQEMQDLFRSNDVVGRIGGDEFVVFLRGIKQKKHIADKAGDICKIFDLLYSGDDGEKITGSLGIALFPEDGDTYDELFKKADIALYTSKASGKNTYTFYDEEKTDEMPEPVPRKTHVNRYSRDAILSMGNAALEHEITGLAFDVMDTTENVESAVNMIISKTGKKFSLSRVTINEPASENEYKCVYSWSSRSVEENLGAVTATAQSDTDAILPLFDKNDIAVFSCGSEDCKALGKFIEPLGTKSALLCAVRDGETISAVVSFHDCANDRVWSVDEVLAAKAIAKTLKNYLFRIRELESSIKKAEAFGSYDALTGLPSYKKFCVMAEKTVAAGFENDSYALICTDILDFEYINDKYGIDKGDELLKAFAKKVSTICDGICCVCRMIADRFLILAKVESLELLSRSLRTFAGGFKAEEMPEVDEVNVVIGVALIAGKNFFNVTMSANNANVAVKYAKKNKLSGVVLYKDEMRVEMSLCEKTRREAETALKNDDFAVYLQPKVSLSDNQIVGAEALIRWKKPDGTLLFPSDFIKYLEPSGFIIKLDFYVYEKVCQYLRKQLDAGKKCVPISVNVSGLHLKTTGFVEALVEIVERYRIPKKLIELELTENVFVENEKNALDAMTAFRKLGFKISIDDFGSGFSSLNLLKNLPVDNLKIDREFFSNEMLRANDKIIISGIIAMAGRMDISIVCEGVETKEQIDFLKEQNCDMVQGFFYAKPVPTDEFDSIKLDS